MIHPITHEGARRAALPRLAGASVLALQLVAWSASAVAQPCRGAGGHDRCDSLPSERPASSALDAKRLAAERFAAERGAAVGQLVAEGFAEQGERVPGEKVSFTLKRAMDRVKARVVGAAPDESAGALPEARTEAVEDLRHPIVRIRRSGEIQVVVKLVEHRPEHVARLGALGLHVEHTLAEHGLVQGWTQPDAIDAIAALGFVRQIRPPGYGHREAVGPQNTQGDAILRAAEARGTFGVSGAGVTVGVISDGVDQLPASIQNGNLPHGVNVLKNPGGNEGTAMAEIVQDIAPGASIVFYGPDTDLDMVVGINSLRDAGARVVVDDLTFFNQAKFEDDIIAQAQRAFATAGRVYVSAAGNRALQHYRAVYNRIPGQFLTNWVGIHGYDQSGDMGNTLSLPPGCGIFINLHWNNKKGQSADDLDLALFRSGTNELLAAGFDFQTGVEDAFESLFFVNDTGSTMSVYISILEFLLVSPPSAIVLDYFASLDCSSDSQLQYETLFDSVPGNHAVEETVVVAAVNAGANSVAAYSSQGPATVAFPAAQTRRVPNVSGTDCVTTSAAGFTSFCGTSAAAPHLAGVAALVIERNPGLNSQQIHGLLTGTAFDIGEAGYDFVAGFGRADAVRAVLGAAPGGPVLFAAILPSSRSVAPGSPATAFLTILNAGSATATQVQVLSGLPVPLTRSVTETDPLTNAPIGAKNAPIDIPGGGSKSFVMSLTPSAEMASTDVLFNIVGSNTGPAPTQVGVNSLLLSAAHGVPDVVALAATTGGNGIVQVPVGATGFFSVATVNLGAGGAITATVDTGTVSFPVSVFVCQTNPSTGECITALATSVATTIGPGETPTFAVFIVVHQSFAFDAALHRAFIRFRDALGITRGGSSVAIQVL